MINRKRKVSTWVLPLGLMMAASGCAQEGEVQDAIGDLQEARQQTDDEVNRLRGELETAKNRVIELEKKLALAEQGITDKVREERKDLAEALDQDRQAVQGEVSEAQQEAESHNEAARKAENVLEKTTPPKQVQAEVSSDSKVVEGEDQVRTTQQEENVEIEQVKGIGEDEQKQKQQDQNQQQPTE